MTLVVLDSGNDFSLVNALRRVGADPVLTTDAEVVRGASRLIFPGQGAIGACMRALGERGLGDAIRAHIAAGKPYLGICLGMQALFDASAENDGVRGLGVLGGHVVRLAPGRRELKVPHMGWNEVRVHRPDPLVDGPAHYYFVHSYHAVPSEPVTVLSCDHGGDVCAAVRKDNVFAVQFHPEKSQTAGLRLLARFVDGAILRVVPAIDLAGGKAVRLKGGRREEATVYHDRPWELAARFAAEGARAIHVVDLDGAFAGEPRQLDLVRRIADAAGVPIQVGGGIRDARAVEEALAAGARWVVLGTAAVRDPALVRELCASHPGVIVVAVDARDGRVAVAGWTETSDVDAVELATRAAGWGAAKLLYTDVTRDGLKTGVNVAATARLQLAVGKVPVIASGGIATLDDLRQLAAAGVMECVVGRAIYDGAFTVREALGAC